MYCMVVCIWTWIQIDSIIFRWGCSSVVERMLCMYEVPGSIPGISMGYFGVIMSVNAFSTKPTWKCLLTLDGMKMRQPGIEPGSTAWKAAMLTTIPLMLYNIPKWQLKNIFFVLQEEGENPSGRIWTRAKRVSNNRIKCESEQIDIKYKWQVITTNFLLTGL